MLSYYCMRGAAVVLGIRSAIHGPQIMTERVSHGDCLAVLHPRTVWCVGLDSKEIIQKIDKGRLQATWWEGVSHMQGSRWCCIMHCVGAGYARSKSSNPCEDCIFIADNRGSGTWHVKQTLGIRHSTRKCIVRKIFNSERSEIDGANFIKSQG